MILNVKTVLQYVTIIAAYFIFTADGANILWIAGLASPSHQIWASVLQKALAKRGHNITALSVDVEDRKTENLTFIHMENVYQFYKQSEFLSDMAENTPLRDISDLAYFRSDVCIPAFKSNGLKQLMGYPRNYTFDLVIHDFAGAQCLLGLISRFGNPPLVSMSASTCPIGISAASGNPQYPGIIPTNHLRVGYSMGFKTRVLNVLLYMYDNLFREYFMIPRQNKMARNYFKEDNLDVAAISRSSVLTFVNLSPADVMQPFFQTVIPVGGMHIKEPMPIIDEDLKDFIGGASAGIVYFALGTNIKSEHFSSSQVKYFLDAFKRFPSYRFVWKYDPAQMKHALSKNVMIRAWMPQNDILAHPMTKLFIGHGGALSCQEASWYGVTQLLLPFIIDQKHNAARAVERGVALQLDKERLSTDIIVDAIDQLLQNSRNNMAVLSHSIRDQPQTPLERAIFWTEYAIRHGSSSKLRSPAQDYAFIQQMALDVIASFLAAILIIFVLRKKMVALFFKRGKKKVE